jgi:hypothetical protein
MDFFISKCIKTCFIEIKGNNFQWLILFYFFSIFSKLCCEFYFIFKNVFGKTKISICTTTTTTKNSPLSRNNTLENIFFATIKKILFFCKKKKSGIYLIYPKPESAWSNKSKDALQLQIMQYF